MARLHVYLLDDCEEDQYLFQSKVSSFDKGLFNSRCFNNFADLARAVEEKEPDVIVTDLNLPESQGLRTFLDVKKIAPNSAIVVLTGSQKDVALKAIQLGAQDYIEKTELMATSLKRRLLFAKERFSTQKALEELATRDPLTKLYNRQAFDTKLEQMFASYIRHGVSFAIVFIDLNDFKKINDTYGHLVGDSLLKLVSSKINTFNRVSDFAARVGGDEFILIASHINNESELASYIAFKREKLCGIYAVETSNNEVLELDLCMSFGGAIVEKDGRTAEKLIEVADIAMYDDKMNNRQ